MRSYMLLPDAQYTLSPHHVMMVHLFICLFISIIIIFFFTENNEEKSYWKTYEISWDKNCKHYKNTRRVQGVFVYCVLASLTRFLINHASVTGAARVHFQAPYNMN